MNGLDIILLVPIAFGLICGLMRGAVKEILSLVGVVISLFVTRIFQPEVTEYVQNAWQFSPVASYVLAMFLLFCGAMLALHFLALLIEKLLSFVMLGWLNKLLGGIFGALKYVLVFSLLLNVFAFFNERSSFVSAKCTENSVLYTPIKSAVASIIPYFFTEKTDENV